MTDELVNQIVQQVLAALAQQGVASPLATVPSPAAPPAGATSRGAAGAAAASRPRPAIAELRGPKSARPAAQRPQKVFLTAEMLLRRLATEAGDGRTIELAHNEFLTPAAADVAEERHLTVKRQPKLLPAPPKAPSAAGGSAVGNPTAMPGACGLAGGNPHADGSSPACAAAPAGLGLVVERPNATARSVLASLGQDKLTVIDYSQTDCWVVNTRLLCEAVAAGAVSAGVVMVPFAADAMVLAGKMPGIRPVQGSRADSVAAAMRHYAANVLVLEHAASTYHEMRTMIRSFAGPRPAQPAAKVLMETISTLEKG